MKLLKSVSTIFLLLMGYNSYSQQLPIISNYYINPYISNPAMAGLNGGNIFLLNRRMWNSTLGNPESFIGTFDGMMKSGNSGYGLMIFNDNVNKLGKTGGFGTYNYKLNLPKSSLLSIGFSLGLEQNRLLANKIKNEFPIELSLANNATQATNLDANFGMVYKLQGITLGLAVFQLFNNNTVIVKDEFATKYDYRFVRQLNAMASYRINVIPKVLSIEPILQVKAAQALKPQTTLSLMGAYKSKAWAGCAYRHHYGFDFLAGILLSNKLSIGYSYGLSNSNSTKESQSAHEIIVGLKLLKSNANLDTDKDGVLDIYDREPLSLIGCKVDKDGISLDADKDRVQDCMDKQSNTPFGAPVDAEGVALDSDVDGVIDMYDREPGTLAGCLVDNMGVAVDGDHDDVPDCLDKELNSHWAAKVDADGVAMDTDNDGVQDVLDLELETPHWQHAGTQISKNASKCIVDAHGITKDTDGDGTPDCMDSEINSPKGSKVNRKGVSVKLDEEIIPENSKDSDADGIADELDLEPNTPPGASADQWGRSPLINNDPAITHRIELDDIEDNSTEWDYYVIVGVFRYYNNLKNYQKYLLKTYDESTQVLVTEQNYYYAWTKKITNKAEAGNEVDRLLQAKLKDYIVGNPWLWREPKRK